jgi:hypothetical protein
MNDRWKNTNEKRVRRRCLTSALVELRTPKQLYIGVLEDLSRLGACVHIDQPMPVDDEVSMTVDGLSLSGIVRHCKSYEGDGYRVGIQITDSKGWPEELQWPIHKVN